LCVDFDSAMPGERLTQDATMVAQEIRVSIANVAQQPRRPLDIREEEADRARRKRLHAPMMKRAPRVVQTIPRVRD
jgi:hypothetical protein